MDSTTIWMQQRPNYFDKPKNKWKYIEIYNMAIRDGFPVKTAKSIATELTANKLRKVI
jgi:hypothetical protein